MMFSTEAAARGLALEYDAARFTPAGAAVLLEHYVALLRAFTVDPDLGVRHLSEGAAGRSTPRPTRREQRGGAAGTPVADGVPEQVVLISDTTVLTRGQCAAQTEAVASGLVEDGLRHGERVRVRVDDPVAAAVSALAVWRAGGVLDLTTGVRAGRVVHGGAGPLGYDRLRTVPGRTELLSMPEPDEIACWTGDDGSERGYRQADLAHQVHWLQENLGLAPGQTLVGHQGPSNMAGLLFEVLWPMAAGATVHFTGTNGELPESASVLHATRRQLSDRRLPAGLRVVCAELVPPWLAARLHQVTIEQCWGPDGFPLTHRTVPHTGTGLVAGRPIAELEVLGDLWQRVPALVTGSLLSGPATTPAGFGGSTSDPRYGPRRGMWNTGRLARWTTEGEIELRGDAATAARLGYPAEETGDAVRRCVDALDVAVFPGGTPVVAVVPAPGTTVEPERLTLQLAALLPARMVPGRVLVSDELPSEPTPESVRETPEQARLREIWQRVLGVGEVGTDVAFFDAGGRSLLVLDLQREVAREFGRDVPITAFFQYPTIAEFSRRVLVGVAEPAPLPEVRPDLGPLHALRSRTET
jgi:hypothetical protein